jgi:zinc transport system permease protein
MELGSLSFLLLVGAFVGAAAGYLGSFMVLKRMSLVGDALSHVALPGMAIAIALHFSPIAGAFIALMIAVVGIWYFEETSNIYPEALVGIFFTTSLALGVLITPEPDLLEALFGNIEKINPIEGFAAIISSIVIILLAKLISRKLLLGIISDELLKSLNISGKKINFIYLLLVGSIVALGVKFVGTLLMGGLVIIPAASAKNVSKSIGNYHLLSVVFGIISGVVGVLLSTFYQIASGPSVVLASIVIFISTYFLKKKV